jgi:hypothetical protein
MTAILLRIIIYVAIAAFVYFGAKRLWRDFTAPFRSNEPAAPPPRGPSAKVDQKKSPDVIELERGADGVYRPPGKRD